MTQRVRHKCPYLLHTSMNPLLRRNTKNVKSFYHSYEYVLCLPTPPCPAFGCLDVMIVVAFSRSPSNNDFDEHFQDL